VSRVLVDTNVLVSFLTDRDPEQQASAAELFVLAAEGGLGLYLHQAVLTELIYVLRSQYGLEPRSIASILDDLLSMPGVFPVDELSWSAVLSVWPETFPDFADGCLASIAAQLHADAIATFDQRFARRLDREGIENYWSQR
jgi:predicted nucleic acid-binding protein